MTLHTASAPARQRVRRLLDDLEAGTFGQDDQAAALPRRRRDRRRAPGPMKKADHQVQPQRTKRTA
ncbi:hypothetical protein ATE80_30385 [Streptomyces kanasensis]|uniref:Uncharacterized protein n=1 Tax=Streptomyces kanasensis TaxID=936756 RepID=A0A117IU03_9ACTN|nr:hypothetical protein ATE80_30385 [Streptomyces kanasensis]